MLRFGYDQEFIRLFKEHVPQRQWNPNSRTWTVPPSSVSKCIEYMHWVGIPVPREIDRLAHSCENVALSPGDIRISSLPGDNRKLKISFTYDAELVSVIKQLHPHHRNYDPNAKNWTIATESLPQLVQFYREIGIQIPTDLAELVSAISARMERNLAALAANLHFDSGWSDSDSSEDERPLKKA